MFYVFDAATNATIAGPFADYMDAEERAMAYESTGRQVETGFVSEPTDDDTLTWHSVSGVSASDVERLEALADDFRHAVVCDWVHDGGDYANEGAHRRLADYISRLADDNCAVCGNPLSNDLPIIITEKGYAVHGDRACEYEND